MHETVLYCDEIRTLIRSNVYTTGQITSLAKTEQHPQACDFIPCFTEDILICGAWN